jgi:hypothetical protein
MRKGEENKTKPKRKALPQRTQRSRRDHGKDKSKREKLRDQEERRTQMREVAVLPRWMVLR